MVVITHYSQVVNLKFRVAIKLRFLKFLPCIFVYWFYSTIMRWLLNVVLRYI